MQQSSGPGLKNEHQACNKREAENLNWNAYPSSVGAEALEFYDDQKRQASSWSVFLQNKFLVPVKIDIKTVDLFHIWQRLLSPGNSTWWQGGA